MSRTPSSRNVGQSDQPSLSDLPTCKQSRMNNDPHPRLSASNLGFGTNSEAFLPFHGRYLSYIGGYGEISVTVRGARLTTVTALPKELNRETAKATGIPKWRSRTWSLIGRFTVNRLRCGITGSLVAPVAPLAK